MQKGQLIRRGPSWLLRYWKDQPDGTRRRVCENRHRTERSVKPLIEDKLRPGNEARAHASATLQQFIELNYLPHIKAHMKPSTQKGYIDIFEDHVSKHVAGLRVQEFRTVDGQRILDQIASETKLSHASLTHIKSFLSGVFSFARRTGALDGANPIQGKGAVVVPKGRPSRPTYAYSLEEVEEMCSVLEKHDKKDLRAAVIVAAYTGLAVGEIRGLKWENIGEDQISVQGNFWRNQEVSTKTKARQAPVPMLPIVAKELEAHGKRNPGNIFVFGGPRSTPLELSSNGAKKIRETLLKAGATVQWKGWHAFRRG